MLFTKPARPGRVKTRLIGELTPEEAAELHAAFLDDLCTRLRGGAFDLHLAWALDRDDEIPDVGLPGVRQADGDLGERLYQALSEAARGADAVAAVGSDHPELDAGTVAEAFRRLRDGEADAVFGPAADGGYYLVALRRGAVDPALFAGVEWSTERVLGQTLARCEKLGLRTSLLPEGHDVDTPQDLEALIRRLRRAPPGVCPRTRALLSRWGRS